MTAIHWRPKFSLRMLLAATAAVAVGIGTLLNASPLLVGAAATFCFAVYGAAALAAVYRRGSSGAFAGGFFLAGVGYLLLVNWLLDGNDALRTGLLTGRLLDRSYELVVRNIPDPAYAGLAPANTTGMPGMGGGAMSGGAAGSGAMPGGMSGGAGGSMGAAMGGGMRGGGLPTIQTPPLEEFRELGQYYWSLFFGLLGGVLARRFHVLRTGERNAPPRAESA